MGEIKVNEKINIGLDRCRFVLPSISINGGLCHMHIEKGEKAEILDISTGEVIKISELKGTIKGIALKGDDDYSINLRYHNKNENNQTRLFKKKNYSLETNEKVLGNIKT